MMLHRHRLQRLHGDVMEKCMRSVPGKTVGIDSLLARRHHRKIHLAAVYWAAPTFDVGHAEIREIHFLLDETSWKLQDYVPDRFVEWKNYAWKITPNGDVNIL